MYLSFRSMVVRNAMVAVFNGGITLVILLIAPLGLAAVLMNTLLVTASTFATATAGDRVVAFLLGGQPPADGLPPNETSALRRRDRP